MRRSLDKHSRRRRRPRPLPMTLVVASVALLPASSGIGPLSAQATGQQSKRHSARGHCPPSPKLRLLQADLHAVLYEAPLTDAKKAIFVCSQLGKRANYELAGPPGQAPQAPGTLEQAALDSHFAAYAKETLGKGGLPRYTVNLLNFNDSKTISFPDGSGASHAIASGIGPVLALVVDPAGRMAWMARSDAISHAIGHSYLKLYAWDKGKRFLLDEGELQPASLAISGQDLYWLHAGKLDSTVLR